mmetsp:Transcript_93097/g.263473  ORF Transcript_93097/g.263473 Transcript_93097/m.263473 type:complete len:261 (+) Transcript_93097:237-1019(+)
MHRPCSSGMRRASGSGGEFMTSVMRWNASTPMQPGLGSGSLTARRSRRGAPAESWGVSGNSWPRSEQTVANKSPSSSSCMRRSTPKRWPSGTPASTPCGRARSGSCRRPSASSPRPTRPGVGASPLSRATSVPRGRPWGGRRTARRHSRPRSSGRRGHGAQPSPGPRRTWRPSSARPTRRSSAAGTRSTRRRSPGAPPSSTGPSWTCTASAPSWSAGTARRRASAPRRTRSALGSSRPRGRPGPTASAPWRSSARPTPRS